MSRSNSSEDSSRSDSKNDAALAERLDVLATTNEELRAENEELRERVEALEAQVTGTDGQSDTTQAATDAGDGGPVLLTSGGQPTKVIGALSDTDGIGVLGNATGTGATEGVRGVTQSNNNFATGVKGEARASSGKTYGVNGVTKSYETGAVGVRGKASRNTASPTYGVTGQTFSDDYAGAGVRGEVRGPGSGVEGITYSNTDGSAGVLGDCVYADTKVSGVHGKTPSYIDGAAGVRGQATDSSGKVYGVKGTTASGEPGAAGVYGKTTTAGGYGVFAEVPDGEGPALFAKATNGQAITANGDANVNGTLGADEMSISFLGASVGLSSNQAIDQNTSTTIAFDDENVDDNNEFDTSTHKFSPSSDGVYHVEANVMWESLSSGTIAFIEIESSGGTLARSQIQTGNSGQQSIRVSKVVRLQSTETVSFDAWQNDANGKEIKSGTDDRHTYATFTRLG